MIYLNCINCYELFSSNIVIIFDTLGSAKWIYLYSKDSVVW